MAISLSHGARSEDFVYYAELDNGIKYPLVEIGRHSYGHGFVVHWDGESTRVEIGRYTSIARGVQLFAGQEHNLDWGTTYPFTHLPSEWAELRQLSGHPLSKGNIVLGSDVWIGYGALIRSGVTVSHGAVIGMGAVVTRDVPPYAIFAGNPAKLIRYRFSPDVVAELLKLAWWNWAPEKVRKIAPVLSQPLTIDVLARLCADVL